MRRMAHAVHLRPEKADEYLRLHRAVWPEVLARIAASNIRNYSIFLRRPEMLLFSTWDYVGDDFEADMASMRADAATQRWWRLTDPCQMPFASHGDGELWVGLDEVFHHD